MENFSMTDQTAIAQVAERAAYWGPATTEETLAPVEFGVDWSTFGRGFSKIAEGESEGAERRIDRCFEDSSYALRRMAKENPTALAALKAITAVKVVNQKAATPEDVFTCAVSGTILVLGCDFSAYQTYPGERHAVVVKFLRDFL
jgi:hypothetical protein